MDITFKRKFGCQEQKKSCLWRKYLVLTSQDRHAVALVKDRINVGHILQKLSTTLSQVVEIVDVVSLKFASDEATG